MVSAKLESAMLRWSGRVAVVTGASSGIGRSIAEELVKKGLQVVGLARRLDRLEELKDEVQGAPGRFHPIKCDITSEEDILAAFEWTKKHLNGVDILVNNAGVGTIQTLIENTTSELRKILDVNVLGLSICTREAVKSMRERGVDDGHIIHINSIAGHYIIDIPSVHFYSGSKHAVTVLTEGLRRELVALNSHIRVTSISPGVVDTEIFEVINPVNGKEKKEQLLQNNPFLNSKDISDAVLYTLGTPPHVQESVCHQEIIIVCSNNLVRFLRSTLVNISIYQDSNKTLNPHTVKRKKNIKHFNNIH
uniref:Dehydrogenase/reductase SDR family member 11 n=1 Tax=Timema shepardi TaxID=629360 RepID=A0A7R9G0A6_TIMSH|nr:unnamed protein product [Timema shepardi]